MSTGVSGIIFTDKSDVSYAIETSFYFEKIANKYRIGSKLGGNVTEDAYNNYVKESENYAFIFELMDSPLDNYAEDLFEPDIYGQSNSENLYSRMKRVEDMFNEVISHKFVSKIVLDINYLFGFKENELVIKVTDFAQTVSSLYAVDDVFVPAIRIIVKK